MVHLLDQPFIIQCTKCSSILADSSMMLILREDHLVLLNVPEVVLDELQNTKVQALRCAHCNKVVGRYDPGTSDILYRNKYQLRLDQCNLKLTSVTFDKKMEQLKNMEQLKKKKKKISAKISKLKKINI